MRIGRLPACDRAHVELGAVDKRRPLAFKKRNLAYRARTSHLRLRERATSRDHPVPRQQRDFVIAKPRQDVRNMARGEVERFGQRRSIRHRTEGNIAHISQKRAPHVDVGDGPLSQGRAAPERTL